MKPISGRDALELAHALGDAPETVIAVHQLRRGLCRAYVGGSPGACRAAVVRGDVEPKELTGYGSDPAALWAILETVSGWTCVEVDEGIAPALGDLVARRTGAPVRYLEGVYHVLDGPPPAFPDPRVRRMGSGDRALLEAAHPDLRGGGFGSLDALLAEGCIACAVVSGEVVSVGHTFAETDRHADIGVFTKEGHRGCGFATAAAAVVARRVREAGKIPVWGAGAENAASLRVAEKLGFREVLRRLYVVLDGVWSKEGALTVM